jgi:AcrR family transcriptional regulator
VPASKKSETRLSAERRREQILTAAIELFSERGFRGVTTRELATRLGVTEPVLYQHFPSKQDLYRAILQRIMERESDPAEQQILQLQAVCSDRDYFTRLAQLVCEWHDANPSLMRLLYFSALEGHDLSRHFYEQKFTQLFQLIEARVAQRMKDGAFRKAKPRIVTYAFLNMVSHQMQVEQFFCCPTKKLPRKEMVKTMVDIFLGGIATS